MSNTVLSLTSRSGSLHQAKLGKNCLKSIQTKWVGPHLMVHNTNAQWPIENQTVITLRVKLKLFSSTQLRFLRRFQMQDSKVKGGKAISSADVIAISFQKRRMLAFRLIWRKFSTLAGPYYSLLLVEILFIYKWKIQKIKEIVKFGNWLIHISTTTKYVCRCTPGSQPATHFFHC